MHRHPLTPCRRAHPSTFPPRSRLLKISLSPSPSGERRTCQRNHGGTSAHAPSPHIHHEGATLGLRKEVCVRHRCCRTAALRSFRTAALRSFFDALCILISTQMRKQTSNLLSLQYGTGPLTKMSPIDQQRQAEKARLHEEERSNDVKVGGNFGSCARSPTARMKRPPFDLWWCRLGCSLISCSALHSH